MSDQGEQLLGTGVKRLGRSAEAAVHVDSDTVRCRDLRHCAVDRRLRLGLQLPGPRPQVDPQHDGSFVREAGTRPGNVAIIQSIVQLAKSFRMSITAEGVETAEDFERMRDLGCDTIQGYLFGKPLSYDRANQMVLGLNAKRLAS